MGMKSIPRDETKDIADKYKNAPPGDMKLRNRHKPDSIKSRTEMILPTTPPSAAAMLITKDTIASIT